MIKPEGRTPFGRMRFLRFNVILITIIYSIIARQIYIVYDLIRRGKHAFFHFLNQFNGITAEINYLFY